MEGLFLCRCVGPTMQSGIGFDGQPLCRLARQVPTPKPSGNSNIDLQRQADYAKEVDIIDRMQKNRLIVGPIHGLMLGHDLEGIATAHQQDLDWTGTYQQLCRLPTWYMCQWLICLQQNKGWELWLTKLSFVLWNQLHMNMC